MPGSDDGGVEGDAVEELRERDLAACEQVVDGRGVGRGRGGAEVDRAELLVAVVEEPVPAAQVDELALPLRRRPPHLRGPGLVDGLPADGRLLDRDRRRLGLGHRSRMAHGSDTEEVASSGGLERFVPFLEEVGVGAFGRPVRDRDL